MTKQLNTINLLAAEVEALTSATRVEAFRRVAGARCWGVDTPVWRKTWKSWFQSDYTPAQNPFAEERHDAYFNQFKGFATNPRAGLKQQFAYLAVHQKWEIGGEKWKHEKAKLFGGVSKSTQRSSVHGKASQSVAKKIHHSQDFTTDPGATLDQQFSQLARHHGWKIGSTIWMQERAKLFKEEFKNPQTTIAQVSRDAYFNQFTDFTPDPSNTLSQEFQRLAKQQNWDKDVRKSERAKLYNSEFTEVFGRKGALKEWQKFCKSIGITVGIDSIPKCKEELRKVYFNIINVLEHERHPNIPLIRFKDREAFLDYTRRDRIFPLEDAKENPFLEQLLRKLYDDPKHT